MANYNKQFNFRNGVQVDNDNLVVSPTGLVGIGTTVPTEHLDVLGNVKVSGFSTSPSLFAQTLEVRDSTTTPNVTFTDFIVGSGVTIGSGIVTATGSGIVTYYGDARFLQGMPTSQWKDVDPGLGFTSIYNEGNVGVGTTDPRFTFQIGGTNDISLVGFSSGVGFSTAGDILATGIATATAFVGIGSLLTELDANNIAYGTIGTERIPVIPNYLLPSNLEFTGVVTATRFDGNVQAGLVTATSGFTGDLTGTASTALSLSGTPNIVVGILTANAVAASSFIGGITGDVTGNLTGNVTGTATTASSLTSTANVDIADLTVGLATVSSFIGIGTDYRTGSVAIGNSTTSNGNDLFINRAGILTTNARVQLWSDLGESTVTIGTSESINGYNGQIRYGDRSISTPYSDPYSFDFLNYGNGNINYYLQAGTVGVNTGSFFWHHKSTERLMTLSYEGRLGIGITLPDHTLHVEGSSRVTGIATFENDVQIDGTLTASSLNAGNLSAGTFTGNLAGNVNGPGISTVGRISVGTTVSCAELVIDSGTGLHPETPNDLIFSAGGAEDGFIIEVGGAVGIGTTVCDGDSIITVGGNLTVHNSIGVGTDSPRGLLDLAAVNGQRSYASNPGITTNNFMIPPMVTNAIQTGLATVTGALVYNTDVNKLRIYTGNVWEDLH